VVERIELRSESGTLLGILVGGTAIEIKRGLRLFEVDLTETLGHGRPVILERVVVPDEPVTTTLHMEMEGVDATAS
jgi:hypothetical protein